MARKIEFRAWDKEEERFIYSNESYDDHWFEFSNESLRAFGLSDIPSTIYEPPGVKSRELEEPQQFMGLLDKNGNRVWEGDILKWQGYEVQNGKQIRPERKWLVEWDFETLFKIQNLIRNNGTIEVIGNIWENPELLEGDK